MSKGSRKQYKQFTINTIEDACLALKSIIVPVIVDLEKFDNYTKEAQQILTDNKNHDTISVDVYDSIHDKTLYQQRELLRFIADRQSSSFSYIDLRDNFVKRGFLKRVLPPESRKTLNNLLDLRNWSFHNAQSMIVADLELVKRSIPAELRENIEIKPVLNPIFIPKVRSYSKEMLEEFIVHNNVRKGQFNSILLEMKEDYQEMLTSLSTQQHIAKGIGISEKVQYVERQIVRQTSRGAGSNIASISMGIQRGQFDGTEESFQKLLSAE